MNPFKIAQTFGYKSEDILKFAANSIPGFEDKIKYALAAGYSADQVMNFLQNSFQGKLPKSLGKQKQNKSDGISQITKSMGRHEPDSVMQTKAYAKQKSLGDLLDPGRLALQAGGAAAGFAMGGPGGAIAGAYGGGEAHNEMLKKYQEHIQSGGQMTFEDYLSSLMKGGAKGLAAGATISQAPKILAALKSAKEQQTQTPVQAPEQLQTQPPEVQQAMTTPAFGPKEAFDIVKNEGLEQMFGAVQAKTPEDMLGALKKMVGIPRLKEMSKKYGKPIEEIVGNAFMFTQAPQEAQQAPSIEQMGAPQMPVEEVQAQEQIIAPVQPALQQGRLDQRNVKPLDMGEGDESLIADAYANIFERDDIPSSKTEKQRKIEPLKNALKSSNVRGASYNEETGKMRVVFGSKKGRKGGTVYEYDKMDKKTFEKMTGGKAKPKTEGSNEFGIWFNEKNPSIGAAFSKFIRSDPEKHPFKLVEGKGHSVSEKQILESDRAFIASDIFSPFNKQRERGRSLVEAKVLKDMLPTIKSMDDDFVADMVDFIKDQLKGKLKTAPTVSRLKKEITKEFGQ